MAEGGATTRENHAIKLIITAIASFVTLAAAHAASPETSMMHALAMCRAIDAMAYSSTPCDISGRTVTAVINMSNLEAAKFCGGAREEMQKAGAQFEPGWELKIVRPVSRDIAAICDL